MKQGKRKNVAAVASATSDNAAAAPPDAAYVDRLLDDAAPTTSLEAVGSGTERLPEAGVIELPAQCLLRDAVEYQQRFLNSMDIASLVIDVGAIERIDTAFIQVLLAVARSRAAANQSIVWRCVNTEFSEAVRLLGLQSALAVADVSAAA